LGASPRLGEAKIESSLIQQRRDNNVASGELSRHLTSAYTIAAAQTSSVAGDIVSNIERHVEFVRRAKTYDANCIVFPELSLTGYEPKLAAKTALQPTDDVLVPLRELSNECRITIIAGCPIASDSDKPFLGAFIFQPDRAVAVYRKRFLHGDETQYFVEANRCVVVESCGRKIGVAICADINEPHHAEETSQQGTTIYAAGVAITPNGIIEAETNMAQYATKYKMLTLMANYASPTGGYSIAGRSAIWNEQGKMLAQAGSSGEHLVLATYTSQGWVGRVA